jgi:hypothetical protein
MRNKDSTLVWISIDTKDYNESFDRELVDEEMDSELELEEDELDEDVDEFPESCLRRSSYIRW